VAVALLAISLFATSAQADDSDWLLHISGATHHFEPPRDDNGNPSQYKYNSQNTGIGLEYDVWNEEKTRSFNFAAGTLVESYGHDSGYAATTVKWRVASLGSLHVEPGVGLFAFYRTMGFDKGYTLVVAPLPTLHLQEDHTRLGMNFVLAPSYKNKSGFLFVQLTVKLN
jgi:hypothetical protein